MVMMVVARLIISLIALTACVSGASAMDFTIETSVGGKYIAATGEIVSGDFDRMTAVLDEASVDKDGFRKILLESPGGNVGEAMKVAQLIRRMNFITYVNGLCASACAAVLYPAGRYSVLFDEGRLGFHSCSVASTHKAWPECNDAIAQLAADNGFPLGSVKVFMNMAGPQDVQWMSNVLAPCYGLERLRGDPAPITISTLCPSIVYVLMSENFEEALRPVGPSFDCKKADSPIAQLLCLDGELMHMDALMGRLYRMLRVKLANDSEKRGALVRSQRNWIAQRDAKCPLTFGEVLYKEKSRAAARCVSEQTMLRMDELLELSGHPRLDFSKILEEMGQKFD